jgi:predicted HTH transcriptional regulator
LPKKIPERLADITEEVLLGLIRDKVGEGRTIEYKRDLRANSDPEKTEFLNDVSSFANTDDGDLVFGMDESQGVPTQIVGLQAGDMDLELRRLDSILASGLDPRIRYWTKVVQCGADKRVLLVRVERSWSGPHRVVFKGYDKFFGRNSAGKYPLDVNELRTAYCASAATFKGTGATDEMTRVAVSCGRDVRAATSSRHFAGCGSSS